jgi:serine/threonine protein kinase
MPDSRLIDLQMSLASGAAPAEVFRDCPELQSQVDRLSRFEDGLQKLMAAFGPRGQDPTLASISPGITNYVVLRLLAEGGMGRVYLAQDPRLNREVALKVVRIEKLSEALLKRLRVEARAVAALDHPNIVQIYEVGEFVPPSGGQSVPYLAMEYVPGGTLESHIEDHKPLAPSEAARLVHLLARAIAHAHSRGVVHRDLKPANVLLAPHADEAALNANMGRPKITDFGLARVERDQDNLTLPGTLMGTVAYMAPEQADGRPAGPPADVYALGAILYRLLTGRPVFEAGQWVDTLFQVRNAQPRPVRELVPGVPAELDALCLRCLNKRPENRPTATELADALDSGPTASTRPDRPAWKTAAPRRWPFVVAGLLAAGLLVVALFSLPWWWPKPESQSPPVVEVPALKGTLDAMMKRPGDRLRRDWLKLRDPASRPMRPGDKVRVMVELVRPAYVYVVWVDTEGQVTPMYPWVDGDWDQLGTQEKGQSFKLPRHEGGWGAWTMGKGSSGFETIVLLCRDEPLPPDADIKSLLGTFGRQSFSEQDEKAVTWFKDGEAVLDEPGRGPIAKPVEGGNALERVNHEIWRRAKQRFDFMRSVTYGNEGDRP